MEARTVRQLLQIRITFNGEVSTLVDALNDLSKRHSGFNKLCVEWNPGYSGGGWNELVGYRNETEAEITTREKIQQSKEKSELRHIRKKEAELKKLRKDFKRKFGT